MRAVAVFAVVLALGGCKKPSGTAAPAPAAAPPATTNYQAGGGAAQNVRQAARRTVVLSDLSQLGVLIEAHYNDVGKMPDAAGVKGIIQRDVPKLLEAVNDGTLVLTGTADHGGVWAYESGAETAGGVALVGGSARRVQADELRGLLNR